VGFVSAATNLVSGQAGGSFTNVFEYSVGGGTVRLVSGAGGSATVGGNGNSDSPALDGDGGYVAYRSNATNLVSGQVGGGSNIYEFNRVAGTQTLVSHQAGAPTVATGGASQPVIDDDGHLVSYVSPAGNLIPGQSGLPGVQNVFLWLRQTNANILASGQDGSPTITGNADSDGPLLTRHSFPGFSSKANNLVKGVGGTSIAYINTLVKVELSPNTLLNGTPAGSVIGNLTISSLLAGQYLPPVYRLTPDSQVSFTLAAGGGATGLVTRFLASYATQQSYLVTLHVDIGLGDKLATLQVFVSASTHQDPNPHPLPPSSDRPLTARLVTVKVGKKKKARLMVRVLYADTGAMKEEFLSPYQKPVFTNIQLTVRDSDGDGLADQVVLTAKKGKKKVSATFSN
jgi:hypothetical protein